MKRIIIPVIAVVIAVCSVAFVKDSVPPNNCGTAQLIWYPISIGSYVACPEFTNPIVNPTYYDLYGHYASSPWSVNPLGDLAINGWQMTADTYRARYPGCGTLDEQVCAVAFLPQDVNTYNFEIVSQGGVYYWRPKNPYVWNIPIYCYLCRPNQWP